MTLRFIDHFLGPDTHANRPAASAVNKGAKYVCTTHKQIYSSDQSAWTLWADLSGSAVSALTAKGDLLTFDGSALARLPVGSNGQVLTADSTQADGIKWAAAGGGGGGTPSYIGNNAAGATTESLSLMAMKKVTLAANALLIGIEAFVKGNGSNVQNFTSGLWTDNAGAPGDLISELPYASIAMAATLRWLTAPICRYLVAGDYWIGFQIQGSGHAISLDTTGGSDKTYAPSTFLSEPAMAGAFTSTTKKYSIRAVIL